MTTPDLFDGLDADKLAEVALALLALKIHDQCRAWKSIDWDVMDLLHQKGWIANPRGKAKSVLLTDEGLENAHRMLAKHFAKK